MTINKLKKIHFADRVTAKFQENVRVLTDDVVSKEILDGVLIKNIELSAGSDNIINHKLNRPAIGWIIVRKNTKSDIWDKQTGNILENKTLVLDCSDNVTIDIWIF